MVLLYKIYQSFSGRWRKPAAFQKTQKNLQDAGHVNDSDVLPCESRPENAKEPRIGAALADDVIGGIRPRKALGLLAADGGGGVSRVQCGCHFGRQGRSRGFDSGEGCNAQAHNGCGQHDPVNSHGTVFVFAEVFDELDHGFVPLEFC